MLNWIPQKVENPKPKRIFTRFFTSDPLIFWRESSFSLFPSKKTIYAIARLPPPPPPPNTKAHTLDKSPHQHTGLTETTCKNAAILTAQSLTVASEGKSKINQKEVSRPFFRLQNSQKILSPFFFLFLNYIQCIDIWERENVTCMKWKTYQFRNLPSNPKQTPFSPPTAVSTRVECPRFYYSTILLRYIGSKKKKHPCFTPIHPYQQHL